jgi:hypothetical protein
MHIKIQLNATWRWRKRDLAKNCYYLLEMEALYTYGLIGGILYE